MTSAGAPSMFTLAERPDLAQSARTLSARIWQGAEFIQHDEVVNRHWRALFAEFAALQLVLCDAAGAVVAVGHTIDLAWDGTVADLPSGVGATLARACLDRVTRPPNTLSALLALVEPGRQGDGLSRQVLAGMKAVAARRGFSSLIAPVRPNFKARYPLAPIERYIRWTRPNGTLFDPWLRTHRRLGADILAIAPLGMLVEGSVAEWEGWTSMAFPESGDYVVPGALVPVAIDRERDRGRYEEPNVWMRHPVRPDDG
jgi:GNAT superfamily N-acetyltransferase